MDDGPYEWLLESKTTHLLQYKHCLEDTSNKYPKPNIVSNIASNKSFPRIMPQQQSMEKWWLRRDQQQWIEKWWLRRDEGLRAQLLTL